jgi:hypothetical protein
VREEKGVEAREEKGVEAMDALVEDSRSGGRATEHSPSMTRNFYWILPTPSPSAPDTAPWTPQQTALEHGPFGTVKHSKDGSTANAPIDLI